MNSTPALPNVIDTETMADMLRQQARVKIIDVRTPTEYASVHIPGSYNVPLDQLAEHRSELRDTMRSPAILVCRSGMRARQAERLLREADMAHIHVLDGGIAAWEAAAQPLIRGHNRWGLERQVRGLAGSLVLLGVVGGAIAWSPLRLLSAVVGAGLAYSALTDSCGMAMLLSKLPYNQTATCDVREIINRLANDPASNAS